jgi:hypothetical protein
MARIAIQIGGQGSSIIQDAFDTAVSWRRSSASGRAPGLLPDAGDHAARPSERPRRD